MKFRYTNYKGETEDRDIDVTSLDFLPHPGFGYAPGWFLTGRDRSRGGAMRSFRIDPARMTPIEISHNPIQFDITEGAEVRSAVEKIADRVNKELGDAGLPHRKAD